MLYIHKLSDFQRKAAEVESVYLIRELKGKTPYPFTESKIGDYFADFFISRLDLEAMETTLNLVEPTIELVENLLREENPLYEKANLLRAVQVLKMMPVNLFNNLVYVQDIAEWQQQFITEATSILNAIPQLNRAEEKQLYNSKLSALFEKILRNQELSFNFMDIINEAHVSNVNGLIESFGRGYFFHYTLEEELKKASFESIQGRIPPEMLARVKEIEDNLFIIKKGIDRAYEANMRLVNCALVLYSYVKWMMSGV